MATARTAWGIDLGNRALKAVKLVRDVEGLRIDDYDVIEYEQILSNAGDNRDSYIAGALATFVQRHRTRGVPVAIGVSGQQSFARFIKLPPVETKKIPEIVRFEAIQQIPFPLDDVEWSYQLFQDPESPDIEVGIFAMRKDLVNQYIQYFTDVDLDVQVVQMNPLAVYNAMHYDGRINETTMVVDVGAENTDLIIADPNSAWLRSIPIGGNIFTEALVKSFKLNFPKAEELKRNASSSKYARQILQAMRPTCADLVAEIQRSIGFYASVHRESRITKVVALGGTFRIPGLTKYLQQNLQLEVHRLDQISAAMPPDNSGMPSFSENLLSMVSPYGLAIQAMGEGKIESSLLPEAIKRERMWKDKTKWFAAAAALFVVGTAVAYGKLAWIDGQQSLAQAEQQKIQRINNQATELSRQWSDVEQSGAADRQQIMSVNALLKYRGLWRGILETVHSALPTPQPALLTGDVAQIKSIPRGQRQQIFIDDIVSEYHPNMTAVLKLNENQFKAQGGGQGMPGGMPPDMMGMPPEPGMPGMPGMEPSPFGGEAGANGGTGPRGFVVTIRGTTPNAGSYDFIYKNFVVPLSKHTEDAKDAQGNYIALKKGFYIAKATVVSARPIQQSPERLKQLEAAYQAATKEQQLPSGNRGANRGVFGAPDDMAPPDVAPGGYTPGRPGTGKGESADAAYQDRLTKEDVRQDSEFTVRLAIVLDPQPKAPGQENQP